MSETVPDIQFKVEIQEGVFANTVADATVIEKMYPVGTTDSADIYLSQPKVDENGFGILGMNSVLRFEDLPDGRRAILGNTKHTSGGCPVAVDCSNCALNGLGLATSEMSRRNCSRANTAVAFERTGQDPSGRFVLLPIARGAYVLDDEGYTSEYNSGELMQNRLKPAMSIVVTETWMRENGQENVAFAVNGADGSMGVLTDKVNDEQICIFFFSMRQNMGDRTEMDQILRQGYNAYFDTLGFDDKQRDEAMRNARPSITLSASADLPNFAHKIHIPREDAEAPERERNDAARIRVEYADLVEQADGKITSAIVLEDQFKGALTRGNIYPEFEAKAMSLMDEMGIERRPLTPDRCPGDGQTCNVDYRSETRYALVGQLKQMGVPEASINYDDSQALDPADHQNKMASNRAEQNEGVDPPGSGRTPPRTNRTLNAIRVTMPEFVSSI